MADDDAAASLSQPSPAKGDISLENGDEKSKQCQPFFSMCQPLQAVSYSNSWDSVCAPAATEPCQTSGLDSVDDEYMPSAPSFPDSQQPHSESISAVVDESNKLCSPPSPTDKECDVEQLQLESEELLDDSGVLDGEIRQQSEPLTTDEPSSVDEIKKWGADTKQHSPPLHNTKHWSSNRALEPSDNENKPLSLFFSRFRQPQSVMMKMGSVPFAPLKNTLKNQFEELSSDFRPGQQEDAHEFLRCLLDNLHKCTLDPKSKGKPSSFDEESIVKQVFGGRLKSLLTCRDCGHCSETFEPFLDLSLEIDQVDDLVAALESFTKVEQVGDDENKLTCESCKVQVCKDKRLVLDKAPDVIAFQLKRFTTLDNSIEKIDKHVAYPPELDLKPFHNNPDKEELMYDLYGVVEHSGLPNYGHYVCTIRSSPSTWHLMNDSNVDSITETCALNQEAYILFYVRQGMFPWFSSLLEEARSGASPVSVLDNIDADCLTSSNRSPGDKFEIGETSECKTSLLAEEPTKRSSVDASNSTKKKEETTPLRASFQDDVGRRHAPSASEITNLERPSTPPPCPKRTISVDDFEVFKFEEFDDKDTPLMPKSEHQLKVKKPKAASASKSVKGPSVDKNATRLMRGMPSARRKGLLDCMISQQNVAQEPRRGSRSDPLGKKKRKLDTNSVAVLQY
ncbi:Ubiquitin carboxyl-terminal hydrolase 21 [Triticum urartu]|uniref:Ubiquitin carboxyl-terminal hydrolase 21 n=1 Tax=Triticum urartu TaxID=4572 RepID=M7ZGV9_TRIUA|nr:Ubiquitin carboxyl-terminal hydrolase 21 [Triticum urartu]